ncbi:MAG: hypothetical protein IPJ05_14040 [Nitrosomonas sp.]|nr:hypothetical protein [Nitrosomonas sp.]
MAITFIKRLLGYGNSSGIPTEEGTYQDAPTAWNYLIKNKIYPDSHIVLFGESLGGSIAAWLVNGKVIRISVGFDLYLYSCYSS